ncbi:HAD-IA family hydrolase [Frigidibacter sp. SD6-1]|uniref:HAD-IA family hydrolase n=1 Tax=Frigidibacter sp. SD6-1 TaxID=3032581 RepID=UPI0024DF71A1|nr:HAD-IA family hydrolase [Frigidibacter sp. SD6-1]
MRTVIFDLDGTLADTSADLIAAANHCFREMGEGDLLDPVADALTAFHGGRAMLRLGFGRLGRADDAEVDAHYPVLLQAYEDGIERETKLYPGAVAAVEALRASGHRVGICTNKPARLAEILLARLGIRDLFQSLVGGDTLPVRKPDPAPYRLAVETAGGTLSRSFLVGDTDTDRKTARAAGVPVALVTFGPEGAGVSRYEPEALMGHFDELPALAKRLLP